MAKIDFTDLKWVVEAYLLCGNICGFVIAESILSRYDKVNIQSPKCYNVPKDKRRGFICSLNNAVKRHKENKNG